MILKFVDDKFNFISMFNPKTGAYVRTGILSEAGYDTGVDPFMASFPHLIDVGIMGHCEHGKTGLCLEAGIGCYQSGLTVEQPNMLLADFESIAAQCSGRVYQFALGGRGDPDQHVDFEAILKTCCDYAIVPNFTTSGYGMTRELAEISKKYCGAVAVSWYRNVYTNRAINLLIKAGVKTSIHYILGNHSIDEAIFRLRHDGFPKDINGIVFLLHKPVGLGQPDDVLRPDDARVVDFFNLIDQGNRRYKVGVDSCCVPGIVNFCQNVIPEAIDTCEGGRFSCYISPDVRMLPCSFDQEGKFGVSLHDHTIEQVWKSKTFDRFRRVLKKNCPNCSDRENCMGGCPILPEIVLCPTHYDYLEGRISHEDKNRFCY